MDACLQLGHQPKMMEHLGAADADAVEESLRLVDRAGVYFGLFAHRYGFVPPGFDVSITELEYRRAKAHGVPRLIFFMHEDHPLTAGDVETGPGAPKLASLKDEIGVERVAAFFKSPEDLRAHVLQALGELAGHEGADAEAEPEIRLRGWPPPELPDEPYPLLLSYRHPGLFAGRERGLAQLRAELRAAVPILGLHAVSGAGKSSLLRAGLVPAERAGGRPVAFERRPAEPGLARRLIGDVLEPGASGLAAGDGDPRAFVRRLRAAGRLAGRTPLLVLDQFEDVLRPENAAARARLGPLLAASVERDPGGAGLACRWLLAYRQDFHGRLRAWLCDVLADARALGLEAGGALPHDLSDADRSRDWPLPPFGAPAPGGDRLAGATRAFSAAIETPLAVTGEDGAPRYPWRFAAGGAERLARAFAEARMAQPDAPLVPELQVVLSHLLRQAGDGGGGPAEIRVPAELDVEIGRALENHLCRALEAAFVGQGVAAAREGRTRALLALRELADADGKRGDSLPATELATTIGDGGAEVLADLARTDTLTTQLLSQDPDSLEALHRLLTENRASIAELRAALGERGTSLDLFEQGAGLIAEEPRYQAMLTAVEVALPLPIDGRIDDLEKRGLLAWTLDYAAAHDPSLEERADGLRRQVLAGLPPPPPELEAEDWVTIPAGGFEMGSPESEVGRDDDERLHRVELSAFRMLRHEVTYGELRGLVADHEGDHELPAAAVSWCTAYAYAAWLGGRLGGRLPTEAEWEYAARAGCGHSYCDRDGGETALEQVGWTADHPKFEGVRAAPQPIEQLEPNPWGLYDMYGNVWEWTADWYGPYDAAVAVDPRGPPSGEVRVVRGGGYGSPAQYARAANRSWRVPGIRGAYLGFRVVLPAAPSPRPSMVLQAPSRLAPGGGLDPPAHARPFR